MLTCKTCFKGWIIGSFWKDEEISIGRKYTDRDVLKNDAADVPEKIYEEGDGDGI